MSKLDELRNTYINIWGRASKNGAQAAFSNLRWYIAEALDEQVQLRASLEHKVRNGLSENVEVQTDMSKLSDLESTYINIWGRAKNNGAQDAGFHLRNRAAAAIREEAEKRQDLERFVKDKYNQCTNTVEDLLNGGGLGLSADNVIDGMNLRQDAVRQLKAKIGMADKISGIESALRNMRNEVSDLEGKVRSKDGKISGLESIVQSKDGKINSFESALQNKRNEVSDLEGKVRNKDSKIIGLSNEVDSLSNEVAQKSEEYAALQALYKNRDYVNVEGHKPILFDQVAEYIVEQQQLIMKQREEIESIKLRLEHDEL